MVPFSAPEGLKAVVQLPNAGVVTGMAIPRGVTLIVGGGYHGKSTLLRAIECGVYNHCFGDGRESVVTDASAVKIRAEDGRSVAGVDISTFIGELPGGQGTRAFSTSNASGSTSQAAAIVEALEAGATTLLIDEDTAATNFMIRDRRMQALVPKEAEPITPLVDRVRSLWETRGISTVIVLGGSGDYLVGSWRRSNRSSHLNGGFRSPPPSIPAPRGAGRRSKFSRGGRWFSETRRSNFPGWPKSYLGRRRWRLAAGCSWPGPDSWTGGAR